MLLENIDWRPVPNEWAKDIVRDKDNQPLILRGHTALNPYATYSDKKHLTPHHYSPITHGTIWLSLAIRYNQFQGMSEHQAQLSNAFGAKSKICIISVFAPTDFQQHYQEGDIRRIVPNARQQILSYSAKDIALAPELQHETIIETPINTYLGSMLATWLTPNPFSDVRLYDVQLANLEPAQIKILHSIKPADVANFTLKPFSIPFRPTLPTNLLGL